MMRIYVMHFLCCLIALTTFGFCNVSQAQTPYDQPYGIQWNFITGSTGDGTNGNDNAGEVYASPDGSAWITNGHNGNGGGLSPWGDPKNGGSWDSGFGHITGAGALVTGNSYGLPNVPGYVGENQSYIQANSGMQGTSFIAGWSPNSSGSWTPPTGTRGAPMLVRTAPDGTQDLKVHVPLQTTVRQEGIAYSQSSDVFWFGGGYQNTRPLYGDFDQSGTVDQNDYTVWKNNYGAADESGIGNLGNGDGVVDLGDYNIWRSYLGDTGPQSADVVSRGDGTVVQGGVLVGNYSPYIGKYDPSTGEVTGPDKQPWADGRTHFNDLSVNETTNRVFASGYALDSGGVVPGRIDFDGDGTPEHTFTNSTSSNNKGHLAVFDSNTLEYVNSLVWETPEGDDSIWDSQATSDGGVIAVGRTRGNLKTGAMNPAAGNRDSYIAKYDSDLNLVWDWQAETLADDSAYYVSETTDGNFIVGMRDFTGDGVNEDALIIKLDAAGNVVWEKTIDNSGSRDALGGVGAYDETRIYVSSRTYTQATNPWDNIYTYNGVTGVGDFDNNEILLQKLIPGDFTGPTAGVPDGIVNQDDVDFATAAIGGGLVGDVTYDFNGDGDSTAADITFWVDNIFDGSVPAAAVAVTVPEPSTFVLMAGIAGFGFWRLRKRAA